MKYYSEELDQMFESEKELMKAEKDHAAALKAEKEKKAAVNAERAAAAKEVEAAAQAYREAKENWETKLTEFCKKYGAFHVSIKDTDLYKTWHDLWTELLRF